MATDLYNLRAKVWKAKPQVQNPLGGTCKLKDILLEAMKISLNKNEKKCAKVQDNSHSLPKWYYIFFV